jgi:hypothetical protein
LLDKKHFIKTCLTLHINYVDKIATLREMIGQKTINTIPKESFPCRSNNQELFDYIFTFCHVKGINKIRYADYSKIYCSNNIKTLFTNWSTLHHGTIAFVEEYGFMPEHNEKKIIAKIIKKLLKH